MLRAKDILQMVGVGSDMLLRGATHSPIVASFDITTRCTLRCRHCYFWQQKQTDELTDDEYYTKIVEIKRKHPSLIAAIWMGGEPLLRKDLIVKSKPLFSFNEVITNGTLALPSWKDVRFACSVDGTKKYHEVQRGEGSYDKIRENINRADLNINLICIITKLNQECIEDFVGEWSKTKVRSVGFGFYTPILGKADNDKIWLNFQERDVVLDRLVELKMKYPSFINSSMQFLNSFRSDRCGGITERCRRDYAPFNSMCFSSTLRRKFPCVIGENAECEKCGCGGSVISDAISHRDYSVVLEHLRAAVRH